MDFIRIVIRPQRVKTQYFDDDSIIVVVASVFSSNKENTPAINVSTGPHLYNVYEY